MTNCKNRNGVILHDIVDRWREYFQDLLNVEIPETDIEDIRLVDSGTVKENEEPPTIEEVTTAVKKQEMLKCLMMIIYQHN